MVIHVKIVLRVIERSQLECSVSVAVITSNERQFSSEEDKLFFVLVIPKIIVGSHKDNQTVLDRKTLHSKTLTYTCRCSAYTEEGK